MVFKPRMYEVKHVCTICQNHIRWRHNLTMLMRKRSSTFVINENIEVNIITTLKSIKSSVIQLKLIL